MVRFLIATAIVSDPSQDEVKKGMICCSRSVLPMETVFEMHRKTGLGAPAAEAMAKRRVKADKVVEKHRSLKRQRIQEDPPILPRRRLLPALAETRIRILNLDGFEVANG